MRNYRAKAGSPVRIDYGVALSRGLSHLNETRPLAEPFAAVNAELEAKYEARRKLRRPLLEARQDLRFAEHDAEQAIRRFSREVEIADGGRRGPLAQALIPDGITPLIAPFGAKQLELLRGLVERVEKSRAPGVDGVRTEELPKLKAALTALETAVDAYESARRAYLAAFGDELAVRDEHRLAVERLMGQVRAIFPGDRKRQDLVFPDVEVSSGHAEDDASDGGDDDGGDPGPTG